jgi:hypothetical protein
MVSDLLTHVGRSLAVDVDLNLEPQCEGRSHPEGIWGHDGGPAKYNVVFYCPCGRFSILACAGRVAFYRTKGASCSDCAHVFDPSEVRFIEL